jgi:hypothetical protein
LLRLPFGVSIKLFDVAVELRNGESMRHPTNEMEAFFHQYNQMQDKEFRPLDRCGPKRALEVIEKGRAKFANGKG